MMEGLWLWGFLVGLATGLFIGAFGMVPYVCQC